MNTKGFLVFLLISLCANIFFYYQDTMADELHVERLERIKNSS